MSDEEIEDMLVSLTAQHLEMREDLKFIKETLVKADETITKVAADVMPTLESVMQSPMLKMLMPKGKK